MILLMPYAVDLKSRRPPLGNMLLVAGTALASVAAIEADLPRHLLLDPKAFRWHQLISHFVLHGGYLHLLGNMLFLVCFGNAVNRRLGDGLYLLVYLALGVATGLVWLLLGPGEPVVGASGAIMGVVALAMVFYPGNHVRVWFWFFIRAGVGRIPCLLLAVAFVAMDLIGLLRAEDDGVGYLAHVVGFLGGYAVGLVTVLGRLLPPLPDERNILELLDVG